MTTVKAKTPFLLTDTQKAELDFRIANHKAGIGKTFTFQEMIENARASLRALRAHK